MRIPALITTTTLAAMIGVAGCGDAAPRTAEAFCGELRAHTTEITALPQTAAEIPALITLYSKMDEVAPLTIQHSWEQLYGSLKTATTVNPADPASVQKAADAAYAAQPAATALVTWAQQTCGLTLGPVAGIPGGASVDTTPITTPPTVTG